VNFLLWPSLSWDRYERYMRVQSVHNRDGHRPTEHRAWMRLCRYTSLRSHQ
jgi:hypothetical protein